MKKGVKANKRLVTDFEKTVACEGKIKKFFFQHFPNKTERVSNYCKCAVNIEHKPLVDSSA